jgi:hypothetical protein
MAARTTTTPTPETDPSFLEAVAVGALSAGVNLPTFLALNAALGGVVLTLVATLALAHRTRPELVPHLLALLVLATGLWALLVWLVTTVGFADARKQRRELLSPAEGGGGRPEEEEEQQQQQRAPTASATTTRRRRRDA